MAHVHEAHGHGSTTVVERDGEGPATALIVLIVVAALALLIWFFAFSGIVIDRGSGGTTNNFNQEQVDTPQENTGPGGNIAPTSGGTGG